MPAVKRPLLFLLLAVCSNLAAQEAPLTIERAVELALTRNERAAIADTTVEAAEARVRRARTAFLPHVDITGTIGTDIGDGSERNVGTGALLTQPIFDARVFPLYRQQRLERDAVRLFASDDKRVLGFDAAVAFLTTLSFEQVLLAAERRREFAQTNLDDVRARFEAGLVSSNDVTRAELELATAVRESAQSRGDAQASRVELETLLNTEIRGPLAPPTALLEAANDPTEANESSVAAAQARRSDIAGQRARVEALRAFADEPSARFFPSVSLSAQGSNFNDGPISNRNNDGFVGLSFAWPVFDAGVRNAERAERLANVRGAELQLELEMRQVARELRSAAVQLAAEQASLTEASAATRAAQKNTNETSILYREGLASALELADATQQLFEAEVAEVTARYRMAVAYLSLHEASGGTAVGEAR